MRQDSTKAAVVDESYHWRLIDKDTPRGTKLQLINRPCGVAQYAQLSTDDDWYTHWAPLPTFED
jgi:hypothetical protein